LNKYTDQYGNSGWSVSIGLNGGFWTPETGFISGSISLTIDITGTIADNHKIAEENNNNED